MNFLEILKNYEKIAIVGTGKNAGKTVALNEFISTGAENSINMGITSIGRDGERQDIVTSTEKPAIFVPAGTLVATAEVCLKSFSARAEILDVTPFETAMGRVIICRTVEDGFIEIAGPDTNKEIREVCNMMMGLGAKVTLIDGALNRKTQASPAVADGVILSTGAVLSRDMEIVIDKTKHLVNILTLPKLMGEIEGVARQAIEGGFVSFIDSNNNIIETNYKTALGCSDKIINEVREDYEYIVLPGTLMNSFLKSMQGLLRFKKIGIIVSDGTKLFTEPMDYKIFKKLGGRVEVVEPINLLAVTVNPYSPEGYYFEPKLFLEAMKEALYPMKVLDCMQGGN